MIIQPEQQDIRQHGHFESTEFRIQFDAKMAHLLSTTLYSDKIAAIIRELSCNAADSHIAAKQTKPFDVELPTRLNPIYTIRDYGTGLTPDQIHNIYTVYGASNKNTSNEFTGCMGLGSKTPACYNTKSATIDSYVDGKHWSYMFHTGQNGVPTLTKLLEEDTAEPNGVRISIPVAIADFDIFRQKAIEIYRWFKQRPNVNPIIQYPATKQMLNYPILDTSCILMGNVLYPLNTRLLDLQKDEESIINAHIIIEMPIGSVEPSISREQLQYTPATKTNIKKKIREIINEISKLNIYKDCKTLHQARLAWIKSGLPNYFHNLFRFNNIVPSIEISDSACSLIQRLSGGQFENLGKRWYSTNTWRDYPIFIRDCHNAKQRIKQNHQTAYLIDKDNMGSLGLTDDDVISAKSLPCAITRSKRDKTIISARCLNRIWTNCKISLDTKDEIIYITGALPSRHTFRRQLNEINTFITSTVYHINTCTLPKIKDLPNFITLDQKIDSILKSKLKELELHDKIQLKQNFPLNSLLMFYPKLPKPLQTELADYNQPLKIDKNIDYLRRLAIQRNLYNPTTNNILDTLNKRYPLLQYLQYAPERLILDYIGEKT